MKFPYAFLKFYKNKQMKTITQHVGLRNMFFAAILTSLIFSFNSCAKKMTFNTSTVVPSAEGSVKVKKDNNNNYSVSLKIKRLANSSRLNPPKKLYIVWMNTANDGIKKIGQLNTSSNLLSSTLKSSLKTTVPFKPVDFFITAEDEAGIQTPYGQVVLSTR